MTVLGFCHDDCMRVLLFWSFFYFVLFRMPDIYGMIRDVFARRQSMSQYDRHARISKGETHLAQKSAARFEELSGKIQKGYGYAGLSDEDAVDQLRKRAQALVDFKLKE